MVDNQLFISNELYEQFAKSGTPKPNDLMVSAVGTLGRTYVVMPKDIFYYKDASVICFENFSRTNPFFIKFLMDSTFMDVQIRAKSTGTTVDTITIEKANRYFIPIPPLNEQTRIVDKILAIFSLIDSIENRQSDLQKLTDNIKKRVLDRAIQGKLVPQDPKDKSASELLKRIREEKAALVKAGKIKRDKNESYIYKGDDNSYYENNENIDDILPFEIPNSWAWCRLGTLIDFSKNESVPASQIDENAWLLDLEDIEKDSGKLLNKKRMKNTTSKSDKHTFQRGNVLYSKLRPYLNKVIIADEDGYCTSEILAFDFGLISSEYAQIYLMSPFFVEYAMSDAYGVKMPRLGSRQGNAAFMPLPPIAEQHRIVKQIYSLFEQIQLLKN